MKKIICMILVAALTACMLSGCDLLSLADRVRYYMDTLEQYVDTLEPEDTSWQAHMQYTLDDQLVDSFYALLEESETLAIAGEDMQAIEEKSDQLDKLYMELIDQNQIAYVYYCTDQSNEQYSQWYLHSSDILSQAESDYNQMAKRVYLSDTPAKEMLFEDWTQQDIDMLLLHDEKIAALEQRNAQILTEYRALEEDGWEENFVALYNELVSNNNQIAQIYGYDNYYEFGSKISFQRDYGSQQLQQMRQHVAQYLAPLCRTSTDLFYEQYDKLIGQDQEALLAILYDSYDDLSHNYLDDYIAQLPASASSAMQGMFESNRVVITHSADAYYGAFTTFVDEMPFCYYGPEYDDTQTMIHELGHYYGSGNYEAWSVPIDLSETHSQGNEWLYIRFLKDTIGERVFACMEEYQIMYSLSTIVTCAMVDEFEQMVYSHEASGTLTLEQYEALMEQIVEKYGGSEFVGEYITDIQSYWKNVVVENPVYYLSYAVSAVAAMDLYLIATEDYQQAKDIYCTLIEDGDGKQGFLWNIQQAGLTGPFEETVYQKLAHRYGK